MGFIGLTRNENIKSEAVFTHVGRRPYDWVSQSDHVHAVRSIFGGIQDVRPWLGRVGSCKAPFSDRWRSEWNSQVRLVRLSCDVTMRWECLKIVVLVELESYQQSIARKIPVPAHKLSRQSAHFAKQLF